MKLVDANVLLYAVNSDASRHRVAKQWLDGALTGDEAIGLPWLCLIAFTRLATQKTLFPRPLTGDEALDQVADWLDAPAVIACNPGSRHVELWRTALRTAGTGGNLVNDAHLAALAAEYRATVVTFDTDFARFAVDWRTPQQLLG